MSLPPAMGWTPPLRRRAAKGPPAPYDPRRGGRRLLRSPRRDPSPLELLRGDARPPVCAPPEPGRDRQDNEQGDDRADDDGGDDLRIAEALGRDEQRRRDVALAGP